MTGSHPGLGLSALETPEGAADLRRRLARLSLLEDLVGGRPAGTSGVSQPIGPGTVGASVDDEPTTAAIREFQSRRGLRVDGVCGIQTWTALVEAGYFPGDRLLYLREPMLQGDDVAELQRRLGTLGFDAGRIDGIFGRATVRALVEFQRNVAIAPDGICGLATLQELERLGLSHSDSSLVGSVRERERRRRGPRTLVGRRIAIGHQGGLGAAVEAVRHGLASAGADALVLLHPDGATLAAGANAAEADAYIGIHLDPALAACRIAYYRGYRYESAGGRHLAELAGQRIRHLLGDNEAISTVGMALPELRYSRMPAVVCELAAVELVVERAPQLAEGLVLAMIGWATATWD